MKSVCDCLKFFDSLILCDIEKHAGIGNLEDMRDYMITVYNDKNIEDVVSILAVFSRINLIIDSFYLDNESDIGTQNNTLRKRMLSWLQERSTFPEVDNDE